MIFAIQIWPRYPKLYCFLYFMNEKINKNAKVENFTIMLGRGVRLIVIDPFSDHMAQVTAFDVDIITIEGTEDNRFCILHFFGLTNTLSETTRTRSLSPSL